MAKTKRGETTMKDTIITALTRHAMGHIEKHCANVQIYLHNPVGIGDHSNVVDAIEKELDEIARYQDHLDIIAKYFK